MARARWLKPEFFKDKKMAALGPVGGLVYEALWCLADDGGMAPCDPERIKGEMFLYWSAVGVPEITGALQGLSALGRVEFYQGGDELFAQIIRWEENQKVHKPSDFRYKDDYHKRGKDLQEIVPEWCSTSAGGVGHSSTPIILDSHTPNTPGENRTTPARGRVRPPWVAQLVDAFAPIGVFKPSKVQAECAEVVARLGIADSLTALGYYVRHPELDKPAFFNPRGFAQKAQLCLDQAKPMSPEEGARWIAANPVRNGK